MLLLQMVEKCLLAIPPGIDDSNGRSDIGMEITLDELPKAASVPGEDCFSRNAPGGGECPEKFKILIGEGDEQSGHGVFCPRLDYRSKKFTETKINGVEENDGDSSDFL